MSIRLYTTLFTDSINSFIFIGFKYIIYSAEFNCLNCIMIECSNEDNIKVLFRKMFQKFKSGSIWHFNIKEHQIGLNLIYQINSFFNIICLAANIQIRTILRAIEEMKSTASGSSSIIAVINFRFMSVWVFESPQVYLQVLL